MLSGASHSTSGFILGRKARMTNLRHASNQLLLGLGNAQFDIIEQLLQVEGDGKMLPGLKDAVDETRIDC